MTDSREREEEDQTMRLTSITWAIRLPYVWRVNRFVAGQILTAFSQEPLEPCVRVADLLQRISVHPIVQIS
jgi:hypothetical protein